MKFRTITVTDEFLQKYGITEEDLENITKKLYEQKEKLSKKELKRLQNKLYYQRHRERVIEKNKKTIQLRRAKKKQENEQENEQ